MTKRECPVKGCSQKHDPSKLMCLSHWHSLPEPLRDELWASIRSHGVFSDEYLTAREACIAFCEHRDPEKVC